MRVLLINPMPEGSLQPPHPVLPLGIACIAAIARDRGADVRVLYGTGTKTTLDTLLETWRPHCAGFQTFVNSMSICHELAETIRRLAPNAFIVCGGVEASNHPDSALLSPAIDAVIPGEGEVIFGDLLDRLPDDAFTTAGLIYRDSNGTIRTNPGKSLYENLDDLPPIPYDLFYSPNHAPVGHILTHRGCPFHCSHCPLRFRAGVPIRAHSAERIIQTITDLHRVYGVKHIEFYDENFTMDHDHVEAICHGIDSLPVSFSCTARISQITDKLCRRMADAGCRSIVFGIGTGVPRLQDVLGTHENLDHARQLIGRLPSMGIQPIAVFSMGLPSETAADFKQTVDYAMSLEGCLIRFEPAAPLPGSPLYDKASAGGRFTIRTWDQYVRPGQLVYIPAGRRHWSFYLDITRAKIRARLKRIRNHRGSGALSK
ncbi:radical SAM protein [bacterium]|nr:radical SAM protein [candidate division CSSED10-310 bacterium]